MEPFYLELYKSDRKIPNAFQNLAGASNYDPGNPAEFWAVLIPAPGSGTAQAAFIAPAPPDSTVGAWTHGTDTLAPGTSSFAPAQVCIWAPSKNIPYSFVVFAPDGTRIDLNPSPGADAHAWFCVNVPNTVADGIGIWRVQVALKSAQRLPAIFPPRNAVLNPDDLTFPPSAFEHQPLLQINGPRPVCANLRSISVTAGCAAPNRQVTFSADVTNPGHVVNWIWDFGDGSPLGAGAGPITHTYASAPMGPARLTIEREAGCDPPFQSASVAVTPCDCPMLTGLSVSSGCAPGTVSFQATGQNLGSAQGFVWNFGDGFTMQTAGPTASHSYAQAPASPGSVTVSVEVVSPSNCPQQPPQSVSVPACCPVLSDVEITSGCAPGIVSFKAFGQNLGAAQSFHWVFGDGSSMDTDGPTTSHPYAQAPANPGSLAATVTMVSPANCPLSAPKSVTVPGCPVKCPQLLDVRIISDQQCAPGTIKFQADVDDLSSVQGWNWDFGDGSTGNSGQTAEHAYTSAGPFQVRVSITRDSRCTPIESSPRSVTVSPCPTSSDGGQSGQDSSLLFSFCALALLLILISIAVGLVAFPIGFCLVVYGYLSGTFPVLSWIGLFFAIGGAEDLLISFLWFLIWLLICGSRPEMCPLLKRLWQFLFYFTIFLPIAGIFLPVAPCIFADAGYLAVLSALTALAANQAGCDWAQGLGPLFGTLAP
jgi:PKD repeat protein